ncbi:MAG: gamma-glutamylcyclotransferase [Rhodospirillales bacterium 20-64-7]|nr:MAG: gamma-glutamylcyclotransferase [Rhodospirillales bacterium 20-64-7]
MKPIRITRESLLDGSLRARQREYAAQYPDMRWRTEAEMATILEEILQRHDPAQDLWVFGYGSLIWNPAFDFAEQRAALLRGWHRRFCLRMEMGRGTPERPGLMLALDHGGACKGVAFRIAAEKIRQELYVLWQREMFGGAYHARWVRLEADGEVFPAVTFVINRAHPRYIKELSVEQTAALIATGSGDLGTCREYLENTISHLKELGLSDAGLNRIAAALPNAP